MPSPSSLTGFLTLLLASARIDRARALDISFNNIQCDESLPVFAVAEEVHMTCNDGESTRCSFGQDVMISGRLQYRGLEKYTYNGTGYASSNLRLLSVEYNLFDDFPIDFCGEWVDAYAYNITENITSCPYMDDLYYFNVPYTLPFDDDDITTWFATGWSGASTLEVRNGYTDDSTLLADCTMHWNTYVTPSGAEGWKTMPSAAHTGIVFLSVLTAILCCCTYMTCCRRRKQHVTDVGFYNEFSKYEMHDEDDEDDEEQ